MAKRKVLVSSCDRCSVEEIMDFRKEATNKRDMYVLPEGWLHVAGNTKTALVFELDMCDKCKVAVLDSAGKGRMGH